MPHLVSSTHADLRPWLQHEFPSETGFVFVDRIEAGRRLAEQLRHLEGKHTVVAGLPRGGIPVAYEIARLLDAPLDVIVVRKLGVPLQPELGMGAIGENDVRVLNDEVIRLSRVGEDALRRVEALERIELNRRAQLYREGRNPVSLRGRVVVVVDDGIATGATAKAACRVARAKGAARVVLATPVAPRDWTRRLAGEADEYVCLSTPQPFFGVGQFYRNFTQTSDEEVIASLRQSAISARSRVPPVPKDGDQPIRATTVAVESGHVRLTGKLTVPESTTGVVVFAHGSGSSRHSPRNRYVASILNDAGLATLLFDLLTSDEEANRANVFDIELLAERLLDVNAWVRTSPDLAGHSVGYFGASTGAAAALWAAADPKSNAHAVVSRGGRPDLAGSRLKQVRAPTLLIVGGLDEVVVRLNRQAQTLLQCEHRLELVTGATHLFEEPGTLETAAKLAQGWFLRHLG